MNDPRQATPLPAPDTDEPGAPRLTMPSRTTRSGAGVDWVSEGWGLFRKAPLMWIVFLVLFFLVHLVLGLIPWIGGLAGTLVTPILIGGTMLGCRSLETGGDLDLDQFIAGFKRNTGPLLAIGVVYLVGELVLLCVFAMFVGWSVVWAALTGGGAGMVTAVAGSIVGVAMGGLVVAALAVPLLAAYWFAPVLTMLHDMPAVPAMRESLMACLRNWAPMLVYGLLMGVLLVVAVIPMGLGLLVWGPLMLTSTYAAYRAIFTEPDAPAA